MPRVTRKTAVRSTRTLSVMDVPITGEDKLFLSQLYNGPHFDAFLNLMERSCIEQDTRLINTDAKDEQAVLAQHRMSKAMWLLFTEIQLKIKRCHEEMMRGEEQEEVPQQSEEDYLQGVE
jgi:hypothetical protein